MSASANPTKKTVYVDVDDEITGIIDKVRSTNESIVALVLPKRATMLQSAVNMKLLKRSADQSDKKVVLITSEPALMPLAGAAGLHVAPTLQSRPQVPSAAAAVPPAAISEPNTPEDEEIDPSTPVGEAANKSSRDSIKPIEIDNRPKMPEAKAKDGKDAKAAAKSEKAPKDKAKKVPNFHKFRALLFVGIAALILLIGFGYWALAVAPKATITLRTESGEIQTDANFVADTNADSLDLEDGIVPAESRDLKKSQSQKVAATGQKDNGTKATGSVTFRNCTDNAVTIPAGTGVSNGNYTFITQNSIRLGEGDFTSPSSGGQCRQNGDHVGKVGVIAQNNGDQYNLGPRSYTVSGFSGVVAQGDQMSGGTTKIVKVVAQSDVDEAKKQITDKQNEVVEELKKELESDGYIGIVDTFTAGTPALTPTPAVGAEANEVVVAGDVTYTMLGIKQDDLKKIVEEKSKDKVDTSKQSILDYGFDDATYEVGKKNGSKTTLSVKTTLVAGPEIKQDDLKKDLAGKKQSEVESFLKNRPGITDVKVKFSPFWVSKVPGKEAKVNFVIEQADGTPITQ